MPKAMFEPQKEIEPTIAANSDEDRDVGRLAPSKPPSLRNSAQAISATAPPPTPLNSATICGIAVIFTLRAAGTPTAVPIDDAERDQAPVADAGVEQRRDDGDRHADGGDAVAANRGARPGQPDQAVDEQREGDDVEDVMKSASGRACEDHVELLRPRRRRLVGFLPLNISSMRSVTRKPPTTLIVPKTIAMTRMTLLKRAVAAEAEHEQAAEQDDAVDRVGARHQRRVQRVRDLGDDREADEAGQHEDREVGDEHQAAVSTAPDRRAPLVDDLAVARDAGAGDDLVVEVEARSVAVVVEQQLEQRLDVARVELAGVLGHRRRQVQRRRRS